MTTLTRLDATTVEPLYLVFTECFVVMFLSVADTFSWPKMLCFEIFDLENIGVSAILVITSSDNIGETDSMLLR